MRNMSFALTTEQIRSKTKTVTRRLGWAFLKHGDLLQPVKKSQGLKKGERVELIGGAIIVEHVCAIRLNQMLNYPKFGRDECRMEGFPLMTPQEFVSMFCEHNGCAETDEVTRIEFGYVD